MVQVFYIFLIITCTGTFLLNKFFPIYKVVKLCTTLNKLTSFFYASVLLLTMNFVITLSKELTTLTML